MGDIWRAASDDRAARKTCYAHGKCAGSHFERADANSLEVNCAGKTQASQTECRPSEHKRRETKGFAIGGGEMSVPGDKIFNPGHVWRSGAFELCFSGVGNLELRARSSRNLVWQSNTHGATKLAMQEDGNLVIYSPTEKPLWASNTQGNPGAFLRLDSDGTFAIISRTGSILWSAQAR